MLGAYLIVYILAYVLLRRDGMSIFTRITSTINSSICVYIVYHGITKYSIDTLYDLDWSGDTTIVNGLTAFWSYLFVDGVFYLITDGIGKSDVFLSLLHHFVGGAGIYFISTERRGIGLGLYFSMTELSTPLLNLSWYFYSRKIKNRLSSTVFGLFYLVFTLARIPTIIFLWRYIKMNKEIINNNLSPLHYGMVYGGSYTLMCLNIIWFLMLTWKINVMLSKSCLRITNKVEKI
jgi:hypothetical protein